MVENASIFKDDKKLDLVKGLNIKNITFTLFNNQEKPTKKN